MKKTIIIVSAFLIILLISSFITPIIYQFTDFKFDRILSRCIMIGVMVSAVLYFRSINRSTLLSLFITSGLRWDAKTSLKSVIHGFIVAFGTIGVLMAIEVIVGARIFRINIKSTFILQLIEYMFVAFIIAFIEEFFFRGLIFNKIKLLSITAAFIITNVFYSIVHFLKPDNVVISDIPTVLDSFRVIGACVQPLFDPITILPGVIGLFLFGIVLSYTYWRTNSLYHAIGIHAGCVFFLKADGFFLHINNEVPVLIFGDKNVYTGLLGWFFIIMIGLIMWYILRRNPISFHRHS